MNPFVLGGCAAGVALAGGAVLRFLPRVRRAQLLRRAGSDYHECRGTEHARLLRQGIDRHEAAVHLLRHEIPQVDAREEADRRLEADEIWAALLRHTVAERLIEIPGIGPKLRDTLLAECFDGTLESLERVGDLAGVGEEKAASIHRWVHEQRKTLPRQTDAPFPERAAIESRHHIIREEIEAERQALLEQLALLEPRLAEAQRELERLSSITVFDFVHAMQGNTAAAERVSTYAMGVYPEWDPAPAWFEGILTDPKAAPE